MRHHRGWLVGGVGLAVVIVAATVAILVNQSGVKAVRIMPAHTAPSDSARSTSAGDRVTTYGSSPQCRATCTTTEAEAGVDGSLTIPASILLCLPIVAGSAPSDVRCAFRSSLASGKLAFRIVLPGLARLLLSEAERAAADIRRQAGVPVYQATHQPSEK